MCGDSKSAITELRPGKDTWRLVVSDKNEATAVADAIKSKDQSLSLQLKVPVYYGIARFVPDSVTDGQLQNLITNCTEVSRIGKTRSYKLRFSRQEDLLAAISSSVIIEYERIRIDKFLPLPPRCYNCQAYGHIAQHCKALTRCSRCAQTGHSNKLETPCQNKMKCALCNQADHPCYSYKCPVAQKLMNPLK